MKNINYKLLRRLDIGTRLILGPLGYLQQVGSPLESGSITRLATPVTNNVSAETIGKAVEVLPGVIKNVYGATKDLIAQHAMKKGVQNAIQETFDSAAYTSPVVLQSMEDVVPWMAPLSTILSVGQSASALGEGVGNIAKDAVNAAKSAAVKGAQTGALSGAKSALGVAAKGAGAVMGAYNALKGTLDLAKTTFDGQSLSSSDIANMAGQSVNYIDGLMYNRMEGYDRRGMSNLMDALATGSVVQGALAGAQAGGGVGSFFTPLGTLIGTGVGALIGSIGGWIGGRKRNRQLEQMLADYKTGADAFNMQEEAMAQSKAVADQYHITHGDYGISVDTKNPNAMVQGGEPIISVNKNGKVVGADMFAITSQTPERVDNIPVRLDKGSTKNGVIGNKINPFTGQRLAVEARPYVYGMHSNDPIVKKYSADRLKEYLDLQDMIPDTYYADKGLPTDKEKMKTDKNRFNIDWSDYRGAGIPLANFMLNQIGNWVRYKDVQNDPIVANLSFVPTDYSRALRLMPKIKDISSQLSNIDHETAKNLYQYSQIGASAGLKLALYANALNNRLSNVAKAYSDKANAENDLMKNVAILDAEYNDKNAARKQQALLKSNEDLRQAYAQKRQLLDTIVKSSVGNLNSLAENLNNIRLGNKNTDLYQQYLTNEQKKWLAQGNNSSYAGSIGRFLPTFAVPEQKSFEEYMHDYFSKPFIGRG